MRDKAHFVLSKSKVLKQVQKVKQYADEVSYSFKTNYEVGKVLEQHSDCWFSVHSLESLSLLQSGKKVWFFAQAWDFEELDELFKKEVRNIVVDNEEDLKTLVEYIKKENEKINLLLRIRLKEHTVHTGKHFVFGLYADQVNRLLPELSKNKHIEKLGIHFHRKTQNVSEWSIKEELSEIIKEENWKYVDIVNIGGGLPIAYKNYRAEVLDYIFKKIQKVKDWLNEKNIRMIIEPGRFIAGPPIRLVTTIKNIYNNNIIVNGSVYNSAMDTFVAHIRLTVEGEMNEQEGSAYVIKGSTPCSTDIYRYRVYLKNPKPGDKIIFLNAGAYNYRSDFCLLPKLRTEVVE